MKHNFITLSALALVLLLPLSCKKEETSSTSTNTSSSCSSNPTYTANVKKIIDASCSMSGCHGAGSANGVFTTYAGLKPYLTSGDFKREVITNKTMPQGTTLSAADYATLNCWVQNNYAE